MINIYTPDLWDLKIRLFNLIYLILLFFRPKNQEVRFIFLKKAREKDEGEPLSVRLSRVWTTRSGPVRVHFESLLEATRYPSSAPRDRDTVMLQHAAHCSSRWTLQ